MDSDLLPDSYSSLCELTRMTSGLITALVDNGLLGPGVPSRVLREVRTRGKLPIRIEGWVKPEKYAEVLAYVGVYT